MSRKGRKTKMSKPIKMTQQYLDECRKDFEKALSLAKLTDGKLSFTKTFTCDAKKATVFFTPEAWAKMVMLIKEFDKEIAWHGVAARSQDESKDEYIISDIMVYPQEVTGASVEMDTEKYALWLMENDEDERFSQIHMQGHSHVNMAPSPSSVDLTHQEEILNMLGDEDFYIFMIWNKSFVSNTKIYDLKKNTLFENTDVTVKISGGTEDLEAFLQSAKKMVKPKSYVSTAGKSGYSYPGYSSYSSPSQPTTGGPYNPLPAPTQPTPKQPAAEDSKGKGKKEKPRTRIGVGWSGIDETGQASLFDKDGDARWPYGSYYDEY